MSGALIIDSGVGDIIDLFALALLMPILPACINVLSKFSFLFYFIVFVVDIVTKN